MEYDIDKIRIHLRLGLGHLLNAKNLSEQSGSLDDLELVYAGDCLAIALDECRSREPETIAGVRGLDNLFHMGSGKHKRRKWSSSQHPDRSNNNLQTSPGETFAAIHCVDEAKQLCDRAEAVRVYAQQSGDYELQNQASEIRLFAAGRASELLAAMEMPPRPRSNGQAHKYGTHIDGPNCATAHPVTLEAFDVIKNRPLRGPHVSNSMSAVSSKSRVGAMLYRWLHFSSFHLRGLMSSLLSPRQWSQLPVLEATPRAKTALEETI